DQAQAPPVDGAGGSRRDRPTPRFARRQARIALVQPRPPPRFTRRGRIRFPAGRKIAHQNSQPHPPSAPYPASTAGRPPGIPTKGWVRRTAGRPIKEEAGRRFAVAEAPSPPPPPQRTMSTPATTSPPQAARERRRGGAVRF